jgi:hypothetical protein
MAWISLHLGDKGFEPDSVSRVQATACLHVGRCATASSRDIPPQMPDGVWHTGARAARIATRLTHTGTMNIKRCHKSHEQGRFETRSPLSHAPTHLPCLLFAMSAKGQPALHREGSSQREVACRKRQKSGQRDGRSFRNPDLQHGAGNIWLTKHSISGAR